MTVALWSSQILEQGLISLSGLILQKLPKRPSIAFCPPRSHDPNILKFVKFWIFLGTLPSSFGPFREYFVRSYFLASTLGHSRRQLTSLHLTLEPGWMKSVGC